MTWFVKDESRHLVLRHYYRGGMVGKLVRDRFWFEGVESSRAMAEYRLLAQLSEQGLPVPRPFAARMVKQGPFYRADILIERIRGAKDLVALLKQGPSPTRCGTGWVRRCAGCTRPGSITPISTATTCCSTRRARCG